jgi:starch-binding outer membrane protein, SusD/RagB family
MKSLINKGLILVLLVSAVFSCQDNEFLSEKNPNIIAKDNYWKDLNETETGLNAVYKTLHNPSLILVTSEMLRSDMAYPGEGRPFPRNPGEFYYHQYNGSTQDISNKWQTNYLGIFRANQVIEALDRLTVSSSEEAEWNSQMAQARFFRGLFHFYLYTTFNNGSIIIRDKVPLTNEDFAKPLSSAQDVIDFIREDLEYAYANLYKKGEYPSNDLSRVTSGAAATILGTSYLYELNYTKAMTYFTDVINNHGYELEYDMSKLFTTAGEFNKESIFEINFTANFVQSELSPWDGTSGTNWINFQTTSPTVNNAALGPAWIIYDYKTEPKDPLDSRNYYTTTAGGSALRNVPLRASAMMAVVEDNQTQYYLTGTVSEVTGIFHGTYSGFGVWKKYSNHDIVTAENQIPLGSQWSSKNVTLNRLADVMLMQAECKIKTGDVDEALRLINEIRKRWGLVLIGKSGSDSAHTYDEEDYDANSLMQRLMHVEKPLEMGAEGHAIRWLDFQRWKKSDNYGFKQRLQELSNSTYYGLNYTFINSKGQSQTRGNFPSLNQGTPPSGALIINYEYDIPYLNYDESKNGTYPIPFAEINANPSIN